MRVRTPPPQPPRRPSLIPSPSPPPRAHTRRRRRRGRPSGGVRRPARSSRSTRPRRCFISHWTGARRRSRGKNAREKKERERAREKTRKIHRETAKKILLYFSPGEFFHERYTSGGRGPNTGKNCKRRFARYAECVRVMYVFMFIIKYFFLSARASWRDARPTSGFYFLFFIFTIFFFFSGFRPYFNRPVAGSYSARAR